MIHSIVEYSRLAVKTKTVWSVEERAVCETDLCSVHGVNEDRVYNRVFKDDVERRMVVVFYQLACHCAPVTRALCRAAEPTRAL